MELHQIYNETHKGVLYIIILVFEMSLGNYLGPFNEISGHINIKH